MEAAAHEPRRSRIFATARPSDFRLPMANGTNNEGKRRSPILMIALTAIVALLVGAGAGALFGGPLLAERNGGAAAVAAHAVGEPREDAPPESPRVLHVVDNLVLNPAGSRGTRFLIATAAFEIRDEALVEVMERRDPEIRDLLVQTLAAKTVDELSDVEVRGSLRKEVGDAVGALLPRDALGRVYFPQFVIQ